MVWHAYSTCDCNAATWEGEDVRESKAHISNTPRGGGLLSEDDPELVALVGLGHVAAFAVLVERHASRHVAFAERFTGSRSDAEDAVQDCFLKLWNRSETFDPSKARFSTWFYRVVMNRCLDGKRRKAPLQLADDFDQIDQGPRPDGALIDQHVARQVKAALADLPDRQRAALVLTYYEELNNKQAAEIMGLNIKALESLLLRARTALAKQLATQRQDLLEDIE